ncbi:MAG: TIGR01440 family protein [Clostridiales bacterium]|nr:TIGR01440 family protein [Clostridiales bacterium]
MINEIEESARRAITELIEVSGIKEHQILVIGCSSSEIMGSKIGTNSAMEAAEAVYRGISPILKEHNIYLAVQCCEHLNRCIILEEEARRAYGYEEVNVVPHPHAGGSFATCAYANMKEPVAVEEIKAHAGMDIGDTLIGMHLKAVAVPVRLNVKKIGEANLVCARTRPKFIGGERAQYKIKGER